MRKCGRSMAEVAYPHFEAAARFLAAARGGALKKATDELRRFPNLAEIDIHVASALGDSDALHSHLTKNPPAVRSSADGWTPLRHVCSSPFHRFSTRHSQ